MDKKEKNLVAFNRFIDKNDIRKIPCNITANVYYEPTGIEVSRTLVSLRLDTWEYGKVIIHALNREAPEEVQEEFNPSFQTYSYNYATRSLIIRGRASKGDQGPYTVTITPIR